MRLSRCFPIDKQILERSSHSTGCGKTGPYKPKSVSGSRDNLSEGEIEPLDKEKIKEVKPR